MKKIAFGLTLLSALTLGLAACNTVAGAGKDIKNAGQGIQNSAERHNHENGQ